MLDVLEEMEENLNEMIGCEADEEKVEEPKEEKEEEDQSPLYY